MYGCSKQTKSSGYTLDIHCHKSLALCYNYNIIILGNSLFLENPQKRKQPLAHTQVTVAPIALLFPRGNDVPSMMKVVLGH